MFHTSTMEQALVQHFLDATVNLFSQTFQLEAKPSKSFILDGLVGHGWEISGTIGITGGAKGIVVVRMHQALVSKLLELSGVQANDAEERREILNGMVGEMVNVIGGNAVGAVEHLNLDISPPMVIQGPDHRISWPRIAPVICVPFNTSAGNFELAVCIKTE